MTTLLALRRAAQAQLAAAGNAEAAQDVALLVAHVLGVERGTLALLDPQTVLTREQAARLQEAVTKRAAHQPISQITGQRLFWGRSFAVTPDVLDPRPDTETLVAAALKQPFTRLLDLGTGTGCILLSLLAETAGATGLGLDISDAALSVAQANAQRLDLSARAAFVQSDWFAQVDGWFDLIVSNPPYIAADEMPGLAPDVREWEPHLALTPGGDGLDPYRIIARDAPAFLRPGGRLMVEIGPTQAYAVAGYFAAAGLAGITVLQDMDGRDRVVAAIKP